MLILHAYLCLCWYNNEHQTYFFITIAFYGFIGLLTLQDGRDNLSRIVDSELPPYAG